MSDAAKSSAATQSSPSETVSTVVRIVLGAVFLLMGLNGFLNFIPMPEMPEPAGEFMSALVATGYMMPLIKVTEIIVGILLITGRFVPLALVLLTPNLVNIMLFHVFLAPAGLWVAGLLMAAHLYLAWSYRDSYRPILQLHALPSNQEPTARGGKVAYEH